MGGLPQTLRSASATSSSGPSSSTRRASLALPYPSEPIAGGRGNPSADQRTIAVVVVAVAVVVGYARNTCCDTVGPVAPTTASTAPAPPTPPGNAAAGKASAAAEGAAAEPVAGTHTATMKPASTPAG